MTEGAKWRHAGRDFSVETARVEQWDPSTTRITIEGTLPTPSASKQTLIYTVFGSGEVDVASTVEPGSDLSYIPEVGTLLEIDERYDTFSWFGRGELETMADRRSAGDVGTWSVPVSEAATKYIRPQESGNRTDVRWASLTDSAGDGLLVAADPLLEVSATERTPKTWRRVPGTGRIWPPRIRPCSG